MTGVRLYSYIIKSDNGAAPNPFFGVCTLAICKPRIRREAEIGDWIAGIAAKRLGQGKLVCAMRVSEVVPMRDYEARFPEKRPRVGSDEDWRAWLGDAIYDFSTDPPSLRTSVHAAADRDHDLSGENVLVSNQFVYFGGDAIDLPPALRPIARVQQGHRSKLNAPHAGAFVRWIESLKVKRNTPLGLPADDPWKGQGPART